MNTPDAALLGLLALLFCRGWSSRHGPLASRRRLVKTCFDARVRVSRGPSQQRLLLEKMIPLREPFLPSLPLAVSGALLLPGLALAPVHFCDR